MKLTPQKKPFHVSLGERGEMIAWSYLRQKGYTLLEKNYRCRIGEIDAIAEKDRRIVFIEIKTRSSSRFGAPEEAVHTRKQRKLLRLAEWYLKEKKWEDKPLAFSVLAIQLKEGQGPEMRLIENAFSVDNT